MAIDNQQQGREPFSKSSIASEPNKNAPMAAFVHRQADGSASSEGFQEGFLRPPFQGQGCIVEKNLKSILDLSEIVGDKI